MRVYAEQAIYYLGIGTIRYNTGIFNMRYAAIQFNLPVEQKHNIGQIILIKSRSQVCVWGGEGSPETM